MSNLGENHHERSAPKWIFGVLKWFCPDHLYEEIEGDLIQRFNRDLLSGQHRARRRLIWLAWICAFISLLGLVGLSAFSANQRTKEIGVRKVLGAGFSDIIVLLSQEVLLLAVLAAVLVFPVSHWLVQQWVQNFAYRAPVNYSNYLLIIVSALISVCLVVLLQSFRTARANPIDSLKHE